jgi:hypothetical protein
MGLTYADVKYEGEVCDERGAIVMERLQVRVI